MKKSKEEQEKEREFNREIQFAISSEIEKFGEASAEHFKNHSHLDKTAKHKLNPQFEDTNLRQQAGFSAEIKNEARTNAENIIKDNKTRIRRTNEVGSVNHPKYDHIEVDKNGEPILDKNGDFIGGSQQKMHKDIKAYDQYTKPELYEKYKGAPTDVPSDQLEAIRERQQKRISKLTLEEQELRKSGKNDLANEKKAEIKRTKDIKKRLRNSKVSSDDALEARRNPTISTAKDIGKIAHQSGVESAKFGGGISGIKNLVSVLNGKKDAKEAIVDTTIDTAKYAGKAYAVGAVDATLRGALLASNKQILNNLAKSNIPALIAQSSLTLASQTFKLIKGEISFNDFAKNVSQESVVIGTSMTGANFGAILGSAIIPGAGTIVGGLIGGMVASMMSSSVFNALKNSAKSRELSDMQREQIHNYCQHLIQEERAYREHIMSIYDSYFDHKQSSIEDAFDDISAAIQNGQNIDKGLQKLGDVFGVELPFQNNNDFKNHIASNKILKL